MSSTAELIDKLYEDRMRTVEESRALMAEVEAGGGEWSGEDQLKWDRFNAEIESKGKRIDYLLDLQKTNQEMDEQRAKFEKIVRPDKTPTDNDDDRMLAFMRAALPDADTWAPRGLEFKIGHALKSRIQAAKSGLEYRDLTKGTSTAGAELIPTSFVARLYEHMVETAAVRQTGATILTTSSGENLLVPKTTGHGTATLVAEGGAFLENDPAFAQVTLNAYKYGQLIQVSRELIEDSAVDLLGYIARAAGLAVGQISGTHFVTGTGTAQPQGVAASPTAGKTGATGQTLTVKGDDLIDLFHSITSGYRGRAVWLMNDVTVAAVRKIQDSSGGAGVGNYMWQPGLQAGAPDLLLGRPVVTDPQMAVMAANAYSIAFGDFSLYYTIRDVDNVRFERSDDYAFANDLVTFRVLIRTDGKQILNGATGSVKFYRNSAT